MKRRKVWRILAALLAALVLAAVVPSAVWVRVVSYAVPLDVAEPVRAAVLADLHGRSFGRDNARLVAKVRAQSPDMIFLVGDMIGGDADAADVQRLLRLIDALCAVAPVYFAPGNHELSYMERDATLLQQAAQAGAVVVNDSYVDVTVSGQPLRIGGTMGHGFYFGRTQAAFEASPEYRFLTAFEDTDAPKICLAHMPDTFIFNGASTLWDVDLAVSGHTHGGLVRLPLIGGLYAPMQGWLPEYDRGQFTLPGGMQLVISAGLAGYGLIPRINNPPEIVILELEPASAQAEGGL